MKWCIDERHDVPCPQPENGVCGACLAEYDPAEMVRRYVVGNTRKRYRMASFDTIEEVHAWQETLDPELLASGRYYIDDMMMESG